MLFSFLFLCIRVANGNVDKVGVPDVDLENTSGHLNGSTKEALCVA